jgi:hypothetical protein
LWLSCRLADRRDDDDLAGLDVADEYFAPMMSSAQVPRRGSGLPSSSPSTSGRMPSGSRAPISFLLVSATSE